MAKENKFRINPESINQEFFKAAKIIKLVVKRYGRRGAIIAATGMMAFNSAKLLSDNLQTEQVPKEITGVSNESSDEESLFSKLGIGIEPSLLNNPLRIDLDEIRSLNVIINDNKCGKAFFHNVCDSLENDGVSFSTTENCENINVDNSVVITLDQLYVSGPNMVFFAPNVNGRKGDSDALTLAMETAFMQNDFATDGIFAGKTGYKKFLSTDFPTRVPTSTEEAIDENNDTSFVTISFGTDYVDYDKVAESIENGLARYVYYKKEEEKYTSNSDLILRVQGGYMMGDVQKAFGDDVKVEDINNFNQLKDKNNYVYMDDTLKNPKIEKINAFNPNVAINLVVGRANKF